MNGIVLSAVGGKMGSKCIISAVRMMVAATFLLVTNVFAQQIPISLIEQMPNTPAPYEMRNWKHVAAGYDSLVFNFNLAGQYLPLIWWRTNTVNYPNHKSFGLHTVVGTNFPHSGEAINVLPAVIGASLIGIDKSKRGGENWVLMCEEYFNRRAEENIYLNHPVASSGTDWWYETMPNVFFYQLYHLYPGTGDFRYQFTTVAEQWLKAVERMGGSAAPWKRPTMNYRAWSFSTMTPNTSGVPEPEAAGAIAWLLYHAFVETGSAKYRVGAELAMEFLQSLSSNPSYELQLPYGAYTAARMNAELGTSYDMQKLLSWCFDVGPLRSWGAIIGRWGGYDVHGLIGEVNGINDYAFAMNTFEQIGALVPLVRYDDRFARAIGKWVLNAANTARLFYPKFLPDNQQDSRAWAKQYDPQSYIAYEALRQNINGLSPFGTGDAIRGGWGKTNLALYGSSHVGILGGIIDTTNVEKILRLDLLKTDYFHRQAPKCSAFAATTFYVPIRRQRRNKKRDNISGQAYPTYLYFNPYNEEKSVAADLGSGRFDLYDAVSNKFLHTDASGLTLIPVPSNNVVVLVIVPSGSTISYDLDKTLVNGVVIDYRSGTSVTNYPPRIKALASPAATVLFGQTSRIYCTAVDRDGDTLSYRWSTSAGTITGTGSEIDWTAPGVQGPVLIKCEVEDGRGGRAVDSLMLNVVEKFQSLPVILSLTARPRRIDLGATTTLTCAAVDSSGASLVYTWSASVGAITGSGPTITWKAPGVAGNYYVRSAVENFGGGRVSDSIGIVVRDFSIVRTGQLVAHYALDGDAKDASGFGHHGTVLGPVPGPDRFGNPAGAYSFDGIDDLVRVANDSSLNFRNAITVIFWMNVGEFFDREAYPLSHGNWENRWKVSITNKRVRWTVKTTAGIKDLDSETKLSLNRYYHVVVLYDGADIEIYINGELDAFSRFSGSLLPTTLDLTLGQHLPTSSGYNFKGLLDDVRIFDYPVSVQAIRQLYSGTTSVPGSASGATATSFLLHQNYPNPFNPLTSINYQLPIGNWVTLTVYDLLGREVATLVKGEFDPGEHSVVFDAKDLPSGVYFYQLRAGNFIQQKKMVLIR